MLCLGEGIPLSPGLRQEYSCIGESAIHLQRRAYLGDALIETAGVDVGSSQIGIDDEGKAGRVSGAQVGKLAIEPPGEGGMGDCRASDGHWRCSGFN